MRKEDLQTKLFIFPLGDWRCFSCRAEAEELTRFAETEKEILLICESCYQRNLILVREGLADF